MTLVRPLPEALPPPSATRCQPRSHVPPSWFLTTSTACSALERSGVLQPDAKQGSLRLFSASTEARFPPEGGPATRRRHRPSSLNHGNPRSAFRTPRRSPPDRSRTVSPRPLPPCRCASTLQARRNALRGQRPSTSRPCSAVGSVACTAVARCTHPLLPWAWFPSRVPEVRRAATADRSRPHRRSLPDATPHTALTAHRLVAQQSRDKLDTVHVAPPPPDRATGFPAHRIVVHPSDMRGHPHTPSRSNGHRGEPRRSTEPLCRFRLPRRAEALRYRLPAWSLSSGVPLQPDRSANWRNPPEVLVLPAVASQSKPGRRSRPQLRTLLGFMTSKNAV
jgi:hypothetical protein